MTNAVIRIAAYLDSSPMNELLDSILQVANFKEGLKQFRIKEFGSNRMYDQL